MAPAKPSPTCTEEAALPLPVLAPALFLSSGQRAVRAATANWQPSHQSFGRGLEPHRMSPGWPRPQTLPVRAPHPPHLSGPLPSWSLLGSDWQVSLCQARRQVLGTAQAQIGQGRPGARALAQQTWTWNLSCMYSWGSCCLLRTDTISQARARISLASLETAQRPE